MSVLGHRDSAANDSNVHSFCRYINEQLYSTGTEEAVKNVMAAILRSEKQDYHNHLLDSKRKVPDWVTTEGQRPPLDFSGEVDENCTPGEGGEDAEEEEKKNACLDGNDTDFEDETDYDKQMCFLGDSFLGEGNANEDALRGGSQQYGHRQI